MQNFSFEYSGNRFLLSSVLRRERDSIFEPGIDIPKWYRSELGDDKVRNTVLCY